MAARKAHSGTSLVTVHFREE